MAEVQPQAIIGGQGVRGGDHQHPHPAARLGLVFGVPPAMPLRWIWLVSPEIVATDIWCVLPVPLVSEVKPLKLQSRPGPHQRGVAGRGN